MALQRLTWKQTLARVAADHRRLTSLLRDDRGMAPATAYTHPSFICVFLYRIANHLQRAGFRHLARLIWHANILLTGADISEFADVDEGLVILSPPGTALMCTAGRNLTLMPCAGIGGELGRWDDIGAGPGLAIVGDDVVMEPHSGILGPIRVGHRARICTVVTQDVPEDCVAEGPRPRFLRRSDPA